MIVEGWGEAVKKVNDHSLVIILIYNWLEMGREIVQAGTR